MPPPARARREGARADAAAYLYSTSGLLCLSICWHAKFCMQHAAVSVLSTHCRYGRSVFAMPPHPSLRGSAPEPNPGRVWTTLDGAPAARRAERYETTTTGSERASE